MSETQDLPEVPEPGLIKVLELGEHYVSDFVREQSADRKKYSLDLYVDPVNHVVRLGPTEDLAPHDSMWGQYWYRSGTNATMKKELQSIVAEVTSRVKLNDGDVWLDIACNDGTLLRAVPDNLTKLGIDPCDDSYYAESSKVAKVNQTYFTKAAFDEIADGKKAKVISCIAMFYDLDKPDQFVADLAECLDDNGVIVLQMSYTPLMLEQMAFDNICHEHVHYYDLVSIHTLFARHGFYMVDASLNDTNGGSFRVYLQKEVAEESSFGTAPLRDVCRMRIQGMIKTEAFYDITNPETWGYFGDQLAKLKTEVVTFVDEAIAAGKTVYGYGASTKGNTLLQLFGLDNTKITAIAERSPYKFGLRTVGTDIPIISEEEMRAAKPDYLLVLPWHFIDEFEKRETEFFAGGGKMIVPCPQFKVIG